MRHTLDYSYPVPSGWRAVCACGETRHGITQLAMLEAHTRHVDEVLDRRPALGPDGGKESQ